MELLEEELNHSLSINDLQNQKKALEQEICSIIEKKREIEKKVNQKLPSLMDVVERKRKADIFELKF